MALNQKVIQAVSSEIYRRFPEVKGKQPRVQIRSSTKGRSIFSPRPTYLLTFRGQATTSTSKTLPYWVRVVIDDRGRILKITMSH
jgi:hypothetical protein